VYVLAASYQTIHLYFCNAMIFTLHIPILHISTTNFIISTNFKDYKVFNLLDKSSVFCIHLFDVRLPEDDLKKMELCWSNSELYVKVYILILVHLLVLSIKLLFLLFTITWKRNRKWGNGVESETLFKHICNTSFESILKNSSFYLFSSLLLFTVNRPESQMFLQSVWPHCQGHYHF